MTQEVVSLNLLDHFVPSKLKLYLRTFFYWLPFVTYPDPLEWAMRKHINDLKKQATYSTTQPPQTKIEDLQTLISQHKDSSFKTKILSWLNSFNFSMTSITREKPKVVTPTKKIDPVNHKAIEQANTFITSYHSIKHTANDNTVLEKELPLLENFASENQQTKDQLYRIIKEFISTEIDRTKSILSAIRDWATDKQKHLNQSNELKWRPLEDIRNLCIQILQEASLNAEKMSVMISRLNKKIEEYTTQTGTEDLQFSKQLQQLELLYKIDEISWLQTHELHEEDAYLKEAQEDQARAETRLDYNLCPLLGSKQTPSCQILEGKGAITSSIVNSRQSPGSTHLAAQGVFAHGDHYTDLQQKPVTPPSI